MDGTENQQDTSAQQDASGGAKGTSEQPKTFTEDDIKAITEKAVSDALSRAGRTAKDFEIREQRIKEAEEREAERQKQQEEKDWAAVKDDPELKKAYLDRKAIQEKERQLAERTADQTKRELEHAAQIKAAEEVQRERVIFEVAAKFDANPADIKEALTELHIENPTAEQITAVAKRTGKPAQPLHVDSGKTKGGGEDLSKLSPNELIELGLKKKS